MVRRSENPENVWFNVLPDECFTILQTFRKTYQLCRRENIHLAITVFPSFSFSARTPRVSSDTPTAIGEMRRNMVVIFSPLLNILSSSLPKIYISKPFQRRNISLVTNVILLLLIKSTVCVLNNDLYKLSASCVICMSSGQT